MSDESASVNRANIRDWLMDHRRRYLESGGVDGHVEDMSERGAHRLTLHCLIRHKGRRSGKTYINPLIYGAIGGEIVLVASKGGADQHPGWYQNVTASSHVDFQIATQAFRGIWREPQGVERNDVWTFMVKAFPPYAEYQMSTQRQIPLLMLSPVEKIPVFRVENVD